MIKEHDAVILCRDLLQHRLRKGDVGVVVHIYNNPRAYEVEFASLVGQTIAVCTLAEHDVRQIDHDQIMHARDNPK